MKVLFNTDKTISGSEKGQHYFTSMVEERLRNYEADITRVEVHLSDENGKKEGPNDVRCLLETRIGGRQPLAVSSQANTVEHALSTAIDKLSATLETTLGKMHSHKKQVKI
ncbi:HPF/RaiA family ribosome-associated protein [Zobellia uliginosa]|uniref:HPF/RaiA family ribosome-associated protein n=1 Tax=Zobellia uliginosa TaxID=143224 RepID=UPI001C0691CB|nr:HPF/RaiA family ribosome-associated protein [Zobellia uliginosa]MBU2946560.1 HPF/RaiA family ribosome-associated protein [Zobellia uliginosa]